LPPPGSVLPPGGIPGDGDFMYPQGSIPPNGTPNVSSTSFSIAMDSASSLQTFTVSVPSWTSNDTIGSLLAIVKDSTTVPGQSGVDIEYSMFDNSTWSWMTTTSGAFPGGLLCMPPVTPTTRSWQGAFVYNGTNGPISAGPAIRFHTLQGLVDSTLIAPL